MKVKEFQQYLKSKKIQYSVFLNFDMEVNPNFFYFTGYSGIGALLIPDKGSCILFAPKMEYERAQKECRQGITIKKSEKRLLEDAAGCVKQGPLGIDYDSISLTRMKSLKKLFKGKKFVDISKHCKTLRTTKTGEEIKLIKEGCKISDTILEVCFQHFPSFKTELEVGNFLEQETRRRGHTLSFPPIVASGKHASMPHYFPQPVKLQEGLCVIDFGIVYKGYCTDTTRTVHIGTPSKKEQEFYAFFLEAYEKTVAHARKRIETGKDLACSNLYEVSVQALGKYAEYFTHGLGHGVGVQIHELPNLKPHTPEKPNKDKIKEGMVFTIEPGTYVPGKFGIRIEDTWLRKHNQLVQLTTISKELRVVKE
jgi:Xaa-Pro aminopeptidase